MRVFFEWMICWTLVIFAQPALAADIYREKPYHSEVHIVGSIVRGDAEKLAVLIGGSYFGIVTTSVEIDSTGGNLNEALRLASLIDGMKLRLTVKKGGLCVSACFFIFASSYDRTAWYVPDDGVLPPEHERQREHVAQIHGYVGVHRPYFESLDQSISNSASKQKVLMSEVRKHLAEQGINQVLIDEMMSRPSNAIYWLRQKDIEMIGRYSPGIEEVMIKACNYRRLFDPVTSSWEPERLEKMYNCEFEIQDREFSPQRVKFAEKLRKGWRPWGVK